MPYKAQKRTDWLTVNGVKVRLVAGNDGTEDFVEIEVQGGRLEGEMPGLYYPKPERLREAARRVP